MKNTRTCLQILKIMLFIIIFLFLLVVCIYLISPVKFSAALFRLQHRNEISEEITLECGDVMFFRLETIPLWPSSYSSVIIQEKCNGILTQAQYVGSGAAFDDPYCVQIFNHTSGLSSGISVIPCSFFTINTGTNSEPRDYIIAVAPNVQFVPSQRETLEYTIAQNEWPIPYDNFGTEPILVYSEDVAGSYPSWFFIIPKASVTADYRLYYDGYELTGTDLLTFSWNGEG